MIESMLTDYYRTVEENRQLNEELKHCDEVARENFNLIAQLEDELRKKNTSNINTSSNDPNIDCQNIAENPPLEKRDVIQQLSVDIYYNPMGYADTMQNLQATIKYLGAISANIEEIFKKQDEQLKNQQEAIYASTCMDDPPVSHCVSNEECESKLKEMQEQNYILATQTTMFEEELAALLEEHNKLMENNNDLIKSIIVCQNEMCKYEFE